MYFVGQLNDNDRSILKLFIFQTLIKSKTKTNAKTNNNKKADCEL